MSQLDSMVSSFVVSDLRPREPMDSGFDSPIVEVAHRALP